jgi:hypothetical protein
MGWILAEGFDGMDCCGVSMHLDAQSRFRIAFGSHTDHTIHTYTPLSLAICEMIGADTVHYGFSVGNSKMVVSVWRKSSNTEQAAKPNRRHENTQRTAHSIPGALLRSSYLGNR